MSDFLTRLAERELGVAPLIAPRLVSRHAGSTVRLDSKEEMRSVLTLGAPMQSGLDRSDAASSVAPSVEPDRGAMDSPATAPPPRRNGHSLEAGDGRGETRPDAAFDEPSPIRVDSESVVPTRERRRIANGTERFVDDSGSAVAERYRQTIGPLEAEQPHPAAEREGAPQALSEPALLVPQPRAAAGVVNASEPWRLEPALLPAGERDTRPTVRVTIGRVEVRAVMPPPAAPVKRAPTTPRLSLGDYLKQRNRERS